jgi:peptidylprolyl isomerase
MQSRIVVLIVLLVGLVAAVVIVVATGGGDEGDGGGSVSTDLSTKPDVPVPEGEPPSELETTDVVEGDGPEAQAGDAVTVQYVGVNYSNGQQFDASWDSGQPFEFELGSGSVIPGWDEGVVGMKVGGRRQLVIPPDLGYGAAGQPPDIPPNETLVFVIDLLDVQAGGGGQ